MPSPPREPGVPPAGPPGPPAAEPWRGADRVAFVLVEPRGEGNVGAAARALKNNGFADLRLVRGTALGDEARRMAAHSEDVLDGARRFDRFEDAIGDAALVAAFTARDRRDLRPSHWLHDAVPLLVQGARQGRVALVFGREDHGLSAQELKPCSFLVTIPAAVERPVYNLAQAVLLAAFALGRALEVEPAPRARTQFGVERSLTAGEIDYLLRELRAALVRFGYDRHPDPGLLLRIVDRAGVLLTRAGLEESDQHMLLGVLRQIEKTLDGPAAG